MKNPFDENELLRRNAVEVEAWLHRVENGAQEGGEKMFETVVQVMLNALLKQGFPDNRRDLRAFLRLAPQAEDSLHFFSRGKIVHWKVSRNKKKELLAELVQLNPQRTLAELKMLIGEFS